MKRNYLVIHETKEDKTIHHLGLIPDGTRRWARLNKCDLFDAYIIAMEKICNIISYLFEQGVPVISVYLLSTENLKRKPSDLIPVINAEIEFLTKLLPKVYTEHRFRVFHAGRHDLLPMAYAVALSDLLAQPEFSRPIKKLYLLAAYNPLDELNFAIDGLVEDNITLNNLWVPDMVDLVVRTSGESRLSNFLPLQSGYAEIIIEEKHFNDLEILDIQKYIEEYKNRNRRFGK